MKIVTGIMSVSTIITILFIVAGVFFCTSASDKNIPELREKGRACWSLATCTGLIAMVTLVVCEIFG